MDGLLVDSEPHWRAAERAVFDTVGLFLTDDQCKQTTGMPIPAVVNYWYLRHPWAEGPGATLGEIADRITEGAHERIGALAQPMPGAIDALNFFNERDIPVAIASASPMSLIEVVIDRLAIRDRLTLWHSATLEANNKPAPDVYWGAARRLGVNAANCIAFEDSGSGVLSAHSAGTITVAVPADFERDDPKFAIADMKLNALTDWSPDLFAALIKLKPTPID
ncbi:HAD-IA family hydrolase [Spirosoma rhododendri]|nr:HAD-IA family hydrolase [Spirosoma rhododendri]